MDTWHKGKIVEFRKISPSSGEEFVGISCRYEGTDHGTSQHDIRMCMLDGGALALSDEGLGEGYIFLYPEQVKHLTRLLRRAGRRIKR